MYEQAEEPAEGPYSSIPRNDTGPKQTQEARLQAIASRLHVFKDQDGEAYVDLDGAAHPAGSMQVRNWLTWQYFNTCGTAPASRAIDGVIGVLRARASIVGQTEAVFLRVAWYGGRTLYLDLANEQNEVVKVTEFGWSITTDPPVRFRRSRGMLPLPQPQSGGSLDELRTLLNMDDGKNWDLIVAWLLGALQPTGTYPILALYGEKGTAKSTTTRYLRSVIDPSTALASGPPRDPVSFSVRTLHNHVVALDNLSGMPYWLSDALCRLASGASDSKKMNYTDGDEFIISAKRPTIINGIVEVAEAGDLLDRTIAVTLPPIPEGKRVTEDQLQRRFDQAHPRILGALLDVVVGALGRLSTVNLKAAPRLADFAVWVTAAEEPLGWEDGHFMAIYQGVREGAVSQELEAPTLAQAIIKIVEMDKSITSTATELLDRLNRTVDLDVRRFTRSWPKQPNRLSGELRRLAPALHQQGIEVEFKGGSGGNSRSITIRRAGPATQDADKAEDFGEEDEEEVEGEF
jgi:hypothetical protein